MSFAQASAFTSVTDIADRSSTGIPSQRALSVEPYPKAIHQLSTHNPQPYHISANMPAVSPEEQQARLEAAYSSRPHAAAGSHGYPFLGDPGYPISSSAVGAHDGKKTTNPWPASNGPLSKCPYSPLSMFPCGSGKTPDRGDKVSTLKSWLYEHRKHPYPTKGEKVMLAVITKMTLTQVSTWFANARRRLKKDSKTTLPAIDRCKDNDDDDNDRNDDSNEVDEATRAPASSNIKSRKALFTHLSTDTEAEKITAPNESIVQDNEVYIADENDICKHQTNEAVSVKTYQNSPFVADSTQDPECSVSSDRPLLVAMSDSHMPDKLSVGEKQRGGQSPLKIKCDRSGRDLEPQISSRLPSKVSPSGEKSSIRQVSSREVSSSTCGRPKIWSVTDFINTPLPSTKLTATSSLSTATATTTTTSTWYSSLPSASLWTSDSLSPLMTTATMLPSAPPKSLPGQHHRSLSQGIIHWPPTAASSFARLTNSYQPRSLPYPHTTGRLAVPVSGQETSAAADGQSWPTLCLHSVYPMFPARVVFSPP